MSKSKFQSPRSEQSSWPPLQISFPAFISDIRKAEAEYGRPEGAVTLIAVSKTFEADAIRPALEAGHRVFGENRVQEAMGKWPELRGSYDGIELHLIGPLQSNKAKEAVSDV
jgi:uncharacterized pyridoxal phosphate-containing UPF0001 family protein